MTTLKRISLLLALGACLAAAGCGSDDEKGAPIPAEQVAALLHQLDLIQARLDQGSVGACEDILRSASSPNQPAVEDVLSTLPSNVDPDVRDALDQSFDNLWGLVESECRDREPDEPAQTETTEPEPEVTETETTPPEPTETETTPTSPEEELPEDGDGESGGAIPLPGTGNGGGVGPGSSKAKKEKK